MKEQGKYTDHIPQASANFINRSLNADGVGEDIRSRAAKHPQASRTVPAWEKDEQILRLAASGATFTQIAEKTGKSVSSVKHRYRESLRNLWNQSPPATQEGFSMGQVFALPRQGRPGPKKG
jgi:DNA-binding NarL/FixJ family response regulator